MQDYEIMYLFPPQIPPKEFKKEIDKLDEMIKKRGGKITQEEYWGLKELTYPIKHFRQGYYQVTWFQLKKENINELEQKLKLIPKLLRFLITILEGKPFLLLKEEEEEKETKEPSKEFPKEPIKIVKPKEKKLKRKEPVQKVTKKKKPKKEEKRKKKEKASLKDLDKKLEEILGEEII